MLEPGYYNMDGIKAIAQFPDNFFESVRRAVGSEEFNIDLPDEPFQGAAR